MALCLSVLLWTTSAQASSTLPPFEDWLASFRREAAQAGISEQTLNAALNGIQPIQKVIDLDRKQPEKKRSFAEYKQLVITPQRIREGRGLLQAYARELKDVERQYGVAPQYVVALWGIETSFGANTGGFSVVSALATLAWEGRRADFFKQELISALKIIDQGHISPAAMKGSWAGAMGQNQFMPSSFHKFAVDHNGDGRRDIWDTEADIFASTANYLHKSGWKAGQRWGRRVTLPASFPESLEGRKNRKPLSYWSQIGVRLPGGGALPSDSGMMAAIVTPDGLRGEAFLVYDNYNVIMDWNRSTYFATAVGLLADAVSTPQTK